MGSIHPEHIAVMARTEDLRRRNGWTRTKLLVHQHRKLRATLRHAVDNSPFYRETIGTLVASGVPLSEFPVLSKHQLIENFDRIVTDERLTLRSLEAHLAGDDPGAPLFNQYRVAATGGTTGERAIIVYDRHAWQSGLASSMRFTAALGPNLKIVGIGASSAIHISGRIYEAMQASQPEAPKLTLSMPVAEVVAALNRYQPDAIITYPSFIRVLVHEQREGRLNISPKVLYSGAEALAAEIRELAHEIWGINIANRYNSTETFASAAECEHVNGMHLPEDLVIYESVDADNCPVADGEQGAKLLVTTLTNRILPLIRYEMSDMVRISTAPCPCGRPFARFAAIDGRREEYLTFNSKCGPVRIHAGQLRSPLIRMSGLRQFQFKADENGIKINIAVRDGMRPGEIAHRVESEVASVLSRHDVAPAQVKAVVVDVIPRSGNGEKERLVLPLRL